MKKKAAVFSCKGLGDGLLSLVISQNFHLNGWAADTYHPNLFEMKNWFMHLPIDPYPKEAEVDHIISDYEVIILSQDKNPVFQKIIQRAPQKVHVLSPSFSKKAVHEKWFDPKIPVAKNFENFCKDRFSFKYSTCKNGWMLPYDLTFRKEKKRILIHPTSANRSKNWKREKFIKIYEFLKKKGFFPFFVLHEKEKDLFKEFDTVSFSHLDDLAQAVYQSGLFIGNDSGVGHLASCLGLPTISLFPKEKKADLWRPAWGENLSVYPSKWIPNFSFFRLRDRYWKEFLFVKKVKKTFFRLGQKTL